MASLSYGKRCLKAVIQNPHGSRKKQKVRTPDDDAIYWCEAGLDKDVGEVKYISDYKGFGVFATKAQMRGAFLLEYVGERLSVEEAEERDRRCPENKMFFFFYKGKQQCIDASATQGHICQFVNDGDRKRANCVMKLQEVRHVPRLCLFALKNLNPGDELLYDYGDLRKNLWWRAKDATKGCENYSDNDDDDDDPFDVGKISDLSSDETTICNTSIFEGSESLSEEMNIFGSILSNRAGRRKNEDQIHVYGQPPLENALDVENDAPRLEQENEEQIHVYGQPPLENALDVENDAPRLEQENEEQIHVYGQPPLENALDVENDAPRLEQEHTNMSREPSRESSKKDRPDRMCCFCLKQITGGKLKRHFKTHPEVANILTRSKHEQDKFFEEKRTEGMYQYNLAHLIDSKLMRERTPKYPDELRMCLNCKKFISNRTFYRHREKCSSNSESMKTQTLKPLDIHKDSEFVVDILNKFRIGEVGTFIRNSELVQIIGYKHYREEKQNRANSTKSGKR